MEKSIGFLAGIGTTFSFCPQVWKISKGTCQMEGLSIYMMAVHFTGVSFWITYGIIRNDDIIILFNAITLALVSSIIMKYIYCRCYVASSIAPPSPEV